MNPSDPESDTEAFSRLELPPPEEVDRVLDLKQEDKGSLPGLYRLNVVRTPVMRLVGFNLLLAVAFLHNHLLLGGVGIGEALGVAVVVEGYALASWLVLWLFFTRVRWVHLGTLFLVGDLLIIDVVILFSGGTESLLWPAYIIRVADQLFTGRRRALGMLLAAMGAYGLLLAYLAVSPGTPVNWGVEALKLLILMGLGVYLVLAATLPWNLQEKAHRARDMILRLEEQALALRRERKRAEEASRAKTEFLARMSHELRTPLNSVIGFTRVLLKREAIGKGSLEEDYLHRIKDNGMHLLALINDILDISRIEEGAVQMEFTKVDLTELVRSVMDQFERKRASESVVLALDFPRGPHQVTADEARLRQVVINLVGNGLKFTEEGKVEVRLEVDEETGTPRALHVEDTGCGISSERLGHIFGAFEQEDGTTSRKHPGTGLGLAISKALCDLMGFRLIATSEPGQGSIFTIQFSHDDGPG